MKSKSKRRVYTNDGNHTFLNDPKRRHLKLIYTYYIIVIIYCMVTLLMSNVQANVWLVTELIYLHQSF